MVLLFTDDLQNRFQHRFVHLVFIVRVQKFAHNWAETEYYEQYVIVCFIFDVKIHYLHEFGGF